MSDIFSKEVVVKPKPKSELWGTEDVEEKQSASPSTVQEQPHLVIPSEIVEDKASSRREIWKRAIKKTEQYVAESVDSPMKVSSTASISENSAVPPPVFQISLDPSSCSEDDDDIMPLTVTCRDELLPSSVINIPPEDISLPSSASSTPNLGEEKEISDTPVEHVVLVVHGINGSEEYLYHNLEKMKASFEEVRCAWFGKQTSSSLCHLELINWKSQVIGIQSSLFEKITPRGSFSIDSRMFFNYAISDVAFYLTPAHCERIKTIVQRLINGKISELHEKFPSKFAKSKISLVGYSLGSVILHDILTDQGTYPLCHSITNLFLWGSPLSAYLSVKDAEYQGGKFAIPNEIPIFNIYHPHDPVAFRIEPLFYFQDSEIADAETIAYWENNGLLVNKAFEKSITDMMTSMSGREDPATRQLVPKRRLDFVLQESMTEALSHKYSMLTAHYSYWSSRDVALFMIKKLTGLEPSKRRQN
jgi:hypothetical protein